MTPCLPEETDEDDERLSKVKPNLHVEVGSEDVAMTPGLPEKTEEEEEDLEEMNKQWALDVPKNAVVPIETPTLKGSI